MKGRNINDSCWVILTPRGARILNAHYRKLEQDAMENGYRGAITLPNAHNGMKLKIQLWELMNIFGEHLYIGASNVFDNNMIYFEEV